MADIRFDGKVAIVTGAGAGLGRSHALALAARGAKVVVNDLGAARDGAGASLTAAQSVVEEIRKAGGEAIADGANVTKPDEVAAMVEAAMKQWGRIDILVNNAGILRDKTFAKMDLADFRAVIDVHLMGTAICTKAVWEIMRQQNYGRVVCTSSPSGLHGIFGQANYGAAKAAMIGFMNALHLEGAKYDIRINLLSPSAKTRMTEDLGIPPEILDRMTPEAITAALLFLVSEDAPSRAIVSCAAGGYARAFVVETDGIYLPPEEQTPENIAARWDEISSTEKVHYYEASGGPTANFLAKAQAAARKE
ncbi:SDR family NAD(P)-dependent oxidoreductase [Amphiplicatus metriothermophilus]|uniref:NAD(P)-dependent dehydrogenase, short-chain alcohol dehydrogenase family n=1 Tax=Amphiplicatus metriothermophilus TaxID=1519374 RepID=A0A239PKW7_9PROT|nr:SDR family NAD(P)-dependent oxidoreductase [Amphiplicatus metriothermophilus]MBB5517440.1 NAD(P)-dependent dehydrogenase (short-subunit alcohol dehydrogenase family) [Amphiplicatus metriothermophilus]SNT68225.1 NAD(P)-dependent dehydrogenase, short-chain alcohol dehydrogenase family [Amphiplicatus metriothermophilus]